MFFEWDLKKAAINFKKHGVSFEEAVTVFGDSFSLTFSDPDHTHDESRFLTVGLSGNGRVLIISHTDRAENVRIINARKMTKRERKFYEENNQ